MLEFQKYNRKIDIESICFFNAFTEISEQEIEYCMWL